MLIAFFAGAISGFLAELVRYDAMAAVLYISPAVEEGLKLILFLLFLFVCQLEDAALPDVAVGIGVGFAMMESIALQYTAGDIGAIALFARAFCSALIHVACALMLILAVRMVRRMALETLSGILGIYAVTVTVHALYNLLISAGGAGEILGYCLPAMLIAAWEAVACHWKGRCEVRNVRTTDEQVNEVFRRAALLRARRLRRKKILLGVCCFALSFHLILLLKGRISMTVATNTATYGSLVFEGIGNHYVLIAVAFFLLGIPAGLGVDRLVRWWKKRRIERYAQKWMGRENASHIPSEH